MELEFIKQIDIFISTLIFSAACFIQIILLFFSYCYLPKFEKKHGLSYKGYRNFFTRSLCLGVLGSLAITKPGSSRNAKLNEKYKSTEYEKFLNIQHEELKWFKISFWLSIFGISFIIIMLLLLGLDKLLGL